MKKFGINTTLLVASCLMMMSCNKQPGFGGNSAITGKLHLKVYNSDFTVVLEDLDLVNTYVYLSASNGYGYLERVKSSFNGTFEFNNLNAGDYTIYAFSMDTTRISAVDIAVEKTVTVGSQNESVASGILTVATNKATGNSSINGRVMVQSQSNPALQYPGQDKRVFIIYNDDANYKTYTRTSFDGYYRFEQLPVGNYRIYSYSVDINNVSLNSTIPVEDSTSITQNGTDVTMSDLVIY